MRWLSCRAVSALVLASTCLLPPARAQDMPMPETHAEKEKRVERKRPSFFHRPAMATAEAQMAYADKLLAEGRPGKAMKHYLALVHAWHDSAQAPAAQLQYARLLEQAGKYESAFEEYQYLIDFFTGLVPHEQIVETQFRLANAVLSARHGRFLFLKGIAMPERAIPLFRQVARNAPNGKRAAEALFNAGLIQERQKDYAEAIAEYESVESRYADGDLAATAAFRRVHCLYLLAKDSPRDEASCANAVSALTAFLSRHARSPDAGQAQAYVAELREHLAGLSYERAAFYDQIAKNPRAALIAYQDFASRFPWSRKAEGVKKRMDELNKDLEARHEP
jgi:outer membrane protein assembly factor BamD (BamD/ComL family)